MDWGSTIANIVLSLSVTVFGYLLVPIIVILKGNKYDAKKLKRINRINCIIVWILFRIIRTAISGEPGTGAAVFLWGAVGQWLLNTYCLKDETSAPTSVSHSTTQASQVHVCLSSEEEPSRSYKTHLTTGADIMLDQNTEKAKVTPIAPTNVHVKQSTSAVPTKYCSRCGKPIDPITKKCQGCGKQYFRGIPWKIIFNVLLPILLGLSIVANTFLYIEKADLLEEVTSLNKSVEFYKRQNSTLTEDKDKYFDLWTESLHEIAFYDQYIVFVADDGSNLYHNYDCKKFQDCTSFWVYGFEGAEDNGYSPCPLCLD